MKFTLIRPCIECPFRSDRPPFFLGRPDRVREILGDVTARHPWPAASFPCHKTIKYQRSGRAIIGPNAQQCAGVMIILHRENRYNDAMQLGERFRLFDPNNLDMAAPVYASAAEAIRVNT